MSESNSKDLILIGPITEEVLMNYCIVSTDEHCIQKPKRRFKIRYPNSKQTEFRDFLIGILPEENKFLFCFIEQISFAPAKYLKYVIHPTLLPASKDTESVLFFNGEFDSL